MKSYNFKYIAYYFIDDKSDLDFAIVIKSELEKVLLDLEPKILINKLKELSDYSENLVYDFYKYLTKIDPSFIMILDPMINAEAWNVVNISDSDKSLDNMITFTDEYWSKYPRIIGVSTKEDFVNDVTTIPIKIIKSFSFSL